MPKSLDELRRELATGLGARKAKDIREAAPADWDEPPMPTDEDLEPAPQGKKPWKGLDRSNVKKSGARGGGGKFTMSGDGDDALLHFGKHKGERISDIAEENPDYLKWMIKSGDFDKDLLEIVEFQLDMKGEG